MKTNTERDNAITQLREMFPVGSTIYTVLRHTSRSGMLRSISVVHDHQDISWLVARATGYRFDRKHGGLRVTGCGMDMGWHLAYELAHALYSAGHECIGPGCPSNDHSNGDRDYMPHHHTDGGYALKHRWI